MLDLPPMLNHYADSNIKGLKQMTDSPHAHHFISDLCSICKNRKYKFHSNCHEINHD